MSLVLAPLPAVPLNAQSYPQETLIRSEVQQPACISGCMPTEGKVCLLIFNYETLPWGCGEAHLSISIRWQEAVKMKHKSATPVRYFIKQ
jgi:hypothetical protein